MTTRELRHSRRYRKATLVTGRLSVIVVLGMVVALLVALAVTALPAPASTVSAAAIVLTGMALVLWDTAREGRAGR